ncbi:MAG: UDP-N-acetylglucosamine 2-epimerase (hydrolyzing) [Phycisphaerales bacterium]|nr:UDP-N-acetylglucosamine 2-epimerase (hydrolyzing) [Phycisphaerales bacterium]
MSKAPRRRVLVATGSRSEFGLLRPVMEAVKKQKGLTLQVAVAGEHLLGPAFTWREVAKAFRIDAKVPMQKPRDKGRAAHAAACGRGVEGFARAISKLKPDWVVVLGDRIEAFAAASAASIAGVAVCHIHGGDRAEGIADEAMRHAITKLAHLHCAATKLSAERIVKMGEPEERVHATGSPALDGLRSVPPLLEQRYRQLGRPMAVALVHPCGLGEPHETLGAYSAGILVRAAAHRKCGDQRRALLLDPNHDPGSEIIRNIYSQTSDFRQVPRAAHLPRAQFIGLLKRIRREGGVLVGNSSAGIIEAGALGLAAINFPPRQDGRERGRNVVDAKGMVFGPGSPRMGMLPALRRAEKLTGKLKPSRLYGDGRAGPRIAALLAKVDPRDPALLRKRIAY